MKAARHPTVFLVWERFDHDHEFEFDALDSIWSTKRKAKVRMQLLADEKTANRIDEPWIEECEIDRVKFL